MCQPIRILIHGFYFFHDLLFSLSASVNELLQFNFRQMPSKSVRVCFPLTKLFNIALCTMEKIYRTRLEIASSDWSLIRMARKYSRLLIQGRYMFRMMKSFPRIMLAKNREPRRNKLLLE